MIVVRDIFHLKFGKAKEAKALLIESKEIEKKFGFNTSRILTDLVTSHSYTLIMESTWDNLAAWENAMRSGLGMDEWQKWYQKFVPLCETAGREILNVVDY